MAEQQPQPGVILLHFHPFAKHNFEAGCQTGRHLVVVVAVVTKGVAGFWSASEFSMFLRYVEPES